MDNRIIKELNVYSSYLQYRQAVLNYTSEDRGLTLNRDDQVYVAVFDIPLESGIVGYQTQTLALIFGLNAHIYHGSGECTVGLEKYPNVMRAMQSLLISSGQILPMMNPVSKLDFYNSKYVRAYLRAPRGLYFKELTGQTKEDKFLLMLLDNVLREIGRAK